MALNQLRNCRLDFLFIITPFNNNYAAKLSALKALPDRLNLARVDPDFLCNVTGPLTKLSAIIHHPVLSIEQIKSLALKLEPIKLWLWHLLLKIFEPKPIDGDMTVRNTFLGFSIRTHHDCFIIARTD